ncbi:hypothetical protein MKX03_027497, partial [Papaver bracteatum]
DHAWILGSQKVVLQMQMTSQDIMLLGGRKNDPCYCCIQSHEWSFIEGKTTDHLLLHRPIYSLHGYLYCYRM